MIDNIMKCLETITYGFKDENGFNIFEDQDRWDNEFEEFYYLASPEELLKTKCGTCWEQVELERKLFQENNIKHETYFICTFAEDASPCHTFLVYEMDNRYYWFEHSWYEYKGIHEYESLEDLLIDVKEKFIASYKDIEGMTFVTKYERPPYHLKCSEMYEYMETQELLRLNKEKYYYVLINDKGIVPYNDEYIKAYREYPKEKELDIKRINIDDEYLQKKMSDIEYYDDYVLIKFNDNIDDFIERCE